MNISALETPVGLLTLAEEDGALIRIWFPAEAAPPSTVRETPTLTRAKKQLTEYFSGSRKAFELPLEPGGTAFQRLCWSALREIPYGETVSYGEIARRIGRLKAARAVGQANHRNPIPILIPCHRVIGTNGGLTGYGGGLLLKEALLRHEREFQ